MSEQIIRVRVTEKEYREIMREAIQANKSVPRFAYEVMMRAAGLELRPLQPGDQPWKQGELGGS